jgi:hypothetical protein
MLMLRQTEARNCSLVIVNVLLIVMASAKSGKVVVPAMPLLQNLNDLPDLLDVLPRRWRR